MTKSNLDKNALSYAVLSKIYMVNFIVIAALICVAGFGVNLKFEDVKGEIYAQNAYFSNFLSERFAAADSELRLIEKYLAANAAENAEDKAIWWRPRTSNPMAGRLTASRGVRFSHPLAKLLRLLS